MYMYFDLYISMLCFWNLIMSWHYPNIESRYSKLLIMYTQDLQAQWSDSRNKSRNTYAVEYVKSYSGFESIWVHCRGTMAG